MQFESRMKYVLITLATLLLVECSTVGASTWSILPLTGLGRDRRMDEEVQYLPESGLARKLAASTAQVKP